MNQSPGASLSPLTKSAASHSTTWANSDAHSRVPVVITQGNQCGPALATPTFRQKRRVRYHSQEGPAVGDWLEFKKKTKSSSTPLSWAKVGQTPGCSCCFWRICPLWDVRRAPVKLWNPGLQCSGAPCRQVGLRMDGASCLIHL